jgi:hypothetical protein
MDGRDIHFKKIFGTIASFFVMHGHIAKILTLAQHSTAKRKCMNSS